MSSGEPILSQTQLETMEGEFAVWPQYEAFLGEHLPDEQIESILDVGGGSGIVMDLLLERFSAAHGVVVDSAEYMIERNNPHERKDAFVGSALNLLDCLEGRRFDLISLNDLLHHLVGPDRAQTKRNVLQLLETLPALLTPRGRVVVYEVLYEGWWPGIEPGDVIYALTKLQLPWFSRFLRRFGANTAGVGVAFRSHDAWRSLFRDASLAIDAEISTHVDIASVPRFLGRGVTRIVNHTFLLRVDAAAGNR